jgi:Putative DNA-binding domain
MAINFSGMRDCLQRFDFHQLFVEELGWSQPTSRQAVAVTVKGANFVRRQISQLAGVTVFEISADDGRIPDAKMRAAVHKEVSTLHHENLLIFLDQARTQSLWYWVKRKNGKILPRDHFYIKGQPGDLFLSKLGGIVFEMSEFDETGNVSVLEVAKRLRNALDVERVTKKFYREFYDEHIAFIDFIEGIRDEKQRRWYASVLLNRLMFIYFLQRKGFIDYGDLNYLQNKLAQSRARGRDLYYSDFLRLLFFEGFAKPEDQRSAVARQVLGCIKYLNGGLFLPHKVEQENQDIRVPDKAFENILALFQRYSWNLNDTPGGEDNEINPDVLGYIFEKYINQKAFGAYYTRTEITEYLCGRTIHQLILNAVNSSDVLKAHPIPGVKTRDYSTIGELLMDLDAPLCRELLFSVLPNLSILDPACGSGAFLVAAMKILINVYAAVIGKIKFLGHGNLADWLAKAEREHKSLNYFIKKRIITDNLYGVDVMEEATEIARLRLFLALVASASELDQLEPLPNIDFNILSGNALVGMMRVDDKEFEQRSRQGNLFRKSYRQILDEKNRLIDNYRHAATYTQNLTALRNDIQARKDEALTTLDDILLNEFTNLGIKYEEAVWDEKKGEQGKSVKRNLKPADIKVLQPFHWGFEFDKVLNERGGFDVIITNPPWEIFKPNSKEFFEEYSDLVAKKKMSIHEFEKAQAKLLKDEDVREAWLAYLSSFPHVSGYYRYTSQYKNQTSIVNGKKAGSDINLYKLFVEQSFNLLRKGGRCGIITAGGVYTDLGTKQLREMLFSSSKLDSLFGLTNEKFIFENVHHAQKFCLLVFEKGGTVESFTAAFRINPREAVGQSELERFLSTSQEHLQIPIDLVRRLSPDSLSVMEFKNEIDVRIARKMVQCALLGERVAGKWGVRFTREFDMTNDSELFKTSPGAGRLPLYEGKMVWQFDHRYAEPRYWVEEKHARKALLGKTPDSGLRLDYQGYRCGIRAVASSTNERSLVASVLPAHVFCGNSLLTTVGGQLNSSHILFLVGILNSMVLDALLRIRVSTNINMFYLYQLPVPRLTDADPPFTQIVDRVSRLICTTPQFDDLAKEVGLGSHKAGATGATERARLRAELDGLIAHVYGLTEDEFAYILTAFPLVETSVKDAALAAHKAFAPKSADQEVAALIAAGESCTVEFKSSGRWDMKQNAMNKALEMVVVKTVAAFLNSETSGTLLIGVDDNRTPIGLVHDYKTLGKKQDRDGYENWLTTLLLGHYGKESSPLIRISFHSLAGQDICRIAVKPSPKPVYVTEGNAENLYIRAGNSTRLLTTKEAIEYSKQRWR